MMISKVFFGGGQGQLAHSQIVEDEQGHGHQELHVLFAGAVQSRFGKFIEQSVGLAVEHAVPLLDGGLADGLSHTPVARSKTRLRFIFLLKVKSKLSSVL